VLKAVYKLDEGQWHVVLGQELYEECWRSQCIVMMQNP